MEEPRPGVTWTPVCCSAPRYLVSLCSVCLRHRGQYLLNANLPGVVRLFFVVV